MTQAGLRAPLPVAAITKEEPSRGSSLTENVVIESHKGRGGGAGRGQDSDGILSQSLGLSQLLPSILM